MPVQSPNGLSVNPGSVSGPSLVQGNVSTIQGNAGVTIRGGGSAPIVPSGSAGLQAHPTVKGSPPIPQLSSAGTGAKANPTTTITSGGSVPNFGTGKSAPLPSGVQSNVLDLGTRTGGVSKPSSGLAKSAPLAGVGAAGGGTAAGGVGLGTSVGAAGAGPVAGIVGAGLAIGLPIGEGIRRGGLAAEEAGLIPDTPIFEPYPEGWWNRQPNETPSPVPITTTGDAPFSGGQSPGVFYDVRYSTEWTQGIPPNSRQVVNSGWVRLYGPISPFREKNEFGGVALGFSHQGGDFTALLAGEHTNPFISDIQISRVDGQPDTGGDPEGEQEVRPGAAPGSIPGHRPSNSPLPSLSPIATPGVPSLPGSGLTPALPQLTPGATPAAAPTTAPGSLPGASPAPSLSPGASPGLVGSPSGSTSPSGRTSRNNKVQPAPANLNQPQPTRKPAPAQPSPCNSGCSVSLEVKLDSLKDDKNKEQGSCTLDEICQKIDQYFEPSTSVSVPFVDCPTGEVDPETGEPVPPEVTPLSADGAGFVGVFQLLESILEGVRLTFDKVPCPEEEAAEDDFPVIIYPSDIYTEFNLESRLLLELTPVDDFPKRTNTSSKWSIEIPNPRADLNWCDDFEDFRFFKGPWYGRAIWSSSGIRSGTYCKDEDEARRVVGLLMGLTQASPKRIRVTDSGREGMYSEEVRVIRAVRSTIENGVVTSCVQYVPTSC